MKTARLEDMTKGWFVGAFSPTAHATDACEVGVKRYKAGDKEAAHLHKVATEITLVLEGRVRMAGAEWSAGDIVALDPGEASDFECLADAVTIVVKTPGALDDKYFVEGSS